MSSLEWRVILDEQLYATVSFNPMTQRWKTAYFKTQCFKVMHYIQKLVLVRDRRY